MKAWTKEIEIVLLQTTKSTSHKAMLTIEVLIAFVIIFMTIVMSATTAKYFNMTFQKKLHYINIYTTVLSIKDKISENICAKESRITGEINNFEYIAECKLIRESPTFILDAEDPANTGYNGHYNMKLNEVTLQVKARSVDKTYHYYLTQAKAR